MFLERANLIAAIRKRVHWAMGGLTIFCMYSFILSKFWDGPCVTGVVWITGGGVVRMVAGGFGDWCSECDVSTKVKANYRRNTHQGLVLLEWQPLES